MIPKTALGLAFIVLVSRALAAELYHQDWPWAGRDAKSLAPYGWTSVLPAGGFVGNYEEPSANDGDSNAPLPTSAVYFGGEQAGAGFFYTTNGARAQSGGATFPVIHPEAYTNLTFTMQSQQSWQGTNLACYFAVQSGGAWYVATNAPLDTYVQDAASGSFQKAVLVYHPQAANWSCLDPAIAVWGAAASNDLTGPITGVGIVVELAGGGSWDFNSFAIAGNDRMPSSASAQ